MIGAARVYRRVAHARIPNVLNTEAPQWITDDIGIPRLVNRLQYRLSIEVVIDGLQPN